MYILYIQCRFYFVQRRILSDKDSSFNRLFYADCNQFEYNEIVKLSEREYIIHVQVWIINENKEILLTQRNLDKIYGGMWEPTGGCVLSGETSEQAIKREIEEELGTQTKNIKLIKTIKYNNMFDDNYFMKSNIKIKGLEFKDSEVINAKWVLIEKVLYSLLLFAKKCHYFDNLKKM